MPYARCINGEYVDDDNNPVDGPHFDPPHLPSTFDEEIEMLEPQRDYVPSGWRPIFDETLDKLRAVSCRKRDGIELSEIAFGAGEMIIAAQGHKDDPVVRGILSRLRQASASTCSCCGTRYGASYRHDCGETLCDRCHTFIQLERTLEDVLDAPTEGNSPPLLEWESLPLNVQWLIGRDKVKTLHLRALGVRMAYVERQTLLDLRQELLRLRKALRQVRGW